MNKIKVVSIVGTRPELIKMSRIFDIFDKNTDHIIVHTGQNYDYELNEIFFNDLRIRQPNYFLDAAGKNASETIANVIKKTNDVMIKEKPDAVLLYGDTNSCLAVIPAKRNKIPIFHMEAGNRCFDERVPEELNRKIVDHLSDINIVLTEHARRYLIAEGIRQDRIFKLGSHMREVINFYKSDIEKSDVLNKLKIVKSKYFILSIHREENIDYENKLISILNSLNAIAEKYHLPVIISTHPRTEKKIKNLKNIKMNCLISFMKPFGFFDYLMLQKNAFCVISDSGTITEESSLLKFPALTIRESHERPEGFDEGTLIMTGLHFTEILNAIDATIYCFKNKLNYQSVQDYEAENVSAKVLKLVLSYVGYIKENVWKEIKY